MKHRHRHRIKAEMNVVPYIDVMLVLLVIFMISTPLMQHAVEITLPQASEENSSLQENPILPLILSIDQAGNYYLNIYSSPQALSHEAIHEAVQNYLVQHPDCEIYLSADANSPYQNIITGIDWLQSAGAKQVQLSSQLPSEVAP